MRSNKAAMYFEVEIPLMMGIVYMNDNITAAISIIIPYATTTMMMMMMI